MTKRIILGVTVLLVAFGAAVTACKPASTTSTTVTPAANSGATTTTTTDAKPQQ
jgi:hypothetical protein